MQVPPESRLTLRAFESTRRVSWHAVVQQTVGFSAELLLLGGFITMGWLEDRARANDPPAADEAVSFLAPFRRYAPPPSEERLQFVGLGTSTMSSAGDVAVPTDHGRQPVALSQAGSTLVAEEEFTQPESDSPRAMTEIEVDSTAALDPTAEGPVYPQDLMQAGVQGVVYAQFVVDSTGYADTLSMQVLDKVQPQFVQAVRHALPRMKYKPAVFAGKRVNQLVQQAFVFRIQPGSGSGTGAEAAPPVPSSKVPPAEPAARSTNLRG